MLAKKILKNAHIDDMIYVVKPIIIRWNSLRFDNANIIYATYIVEQAQNGVLENKCLKFITRPTGTKNYDREINNNNSEYQCFLTPEEAEVWKVLELQEIEDKVENYISTLREKTLNKIKKIKQKEKLSEYLEKYPSVFLKVL